MIHLRTSSERGNINPRLGPAPYGVGAGPRGRYFSLTKYVGDTERRILRSKLTLRLKAKVLLIICFGLGLAFAFTLALG